VPNLLSLRDYLRSELRGIRAAGHRVLVAGYGSQVVANWGLEGVEVMGEVNSPTDFYSRVEAVVVPITHGSGIKVKAVEALAHGVPVLGTDHVRQGFGPSLRKYVHPIGKAQKVDGLVGLDGPDQAQFEAEFGPAAFTSRVAQCVARLGLPVVADPLRDAR
jgi:hypothetical protein